MIEVYTIFTLAKKDVSLSGGRIYYFPQLNGTFGGLGDISAFTPIIFVKEDY